jgi:hypothetical protein
VVPISGSPRTLETEVRSVTYPGAVCGFTFRGTRPASPVTIRLWGTAGGTSFDSGQLRLAWDPGATAVKESGSSSDTAAGWVFLSDAIPNRNGPGWVVQVAGVPRAATLPQTMRCSVTSPSGFSAANGPVGHWAGFATV